MSATLVDWGEDATSFITVVPKETCQFPISLRGIISSDISKKPGYGKLKKVSESAYQYTARARYKGSDAFAITATGKGRKSGTSVISFQVTIK